MKPFLFFLGLFLCAVLRGATIVAATGAAGNWTSGGAWVGGVAPTAADDAQVTVLTTSITINSGAVCRSADFNGCTGTVTASAVLTIGDGTAGAGSIALRLASGMTISGTMDVTFVSTSGTAQDVYCATKSLGAVIFSGAGGSWKFQDTNTSTTSVTHTAGTLDTFGQTCTWVLYSVTGSTARTDTFGASAITLSKTTFSAWDATTVTNYTVTGNTATVTLSGSDSNFVSGAKNYNGLSLVMSGTGLQGLNSANSTFANFTRTGGASAYSFLSMNAGATVTSTCTFTGNSIVNRLYIYSATAGTARTWTLTGATVNSTFTDYYDMTMTPSQDFSAGTANCGLCGNTSGITGTTPVTRYWVGDSGNWTDTAHWSTSSGGSTGATAPIGTDSCVFDANSFSTTGKTVTMNTKRMGGNIDFSAVGTDNPTLSMTGTFPNFYGSFTLHSGMAVTGNNFNPESASNFTFTQNGATIAQNLNPFTPATMTLGSDLTLTGMTQIAASFDAAGYNVTAFGFTITSGSLPGSLSLTMGSGTWTATGTGTVWSMVSASVIPGTSTIAVTNTTATAKTFAGGGKTYNRVTFACDATTITGNNTFGRLDVNTAGFATGLIIGTGSTQTATGLVTTNGAPGSLAKLVGVAGGGTETITSSFYMQQLDYLSVSDLTAAGTAKWYAGVHSTNVTGNAGWQLTAGASTFNSAGNFVAF